MIRWLARCRLAAVALCVLGLALAAGSVLLASAPGTGRGALPEGQSARSWQIPSALPAQEEPPYPAVAYLPLALHSFWQGPYWSGTARFGFCAAARPAEEYNLSRLYADWYVQYPGFRSDQGPGELEYVQIIRLNDKFNPPSQEEIVRYARYHPGTLWLIGNEPDAPAQDCVPPTEYALLYHELYHLLKTADPQAQVAIGGVVQGTPLRLRYLDQVLAEYQSLFGEKIPVDVWNVHGFILRERVDSWGCQVPCGLSATQGKLYDIDDHDDMEIFIEQIVRFRRWMKDNGERNKPLIVSEYGILLPLALGYDQDRVERFMLATFDYFTTATSGSLGYPEDGNRLVQAWAWYSLDHKNFGGYKSYGHLFDPDTRRITPLGLAYGSYTSALR